MNPATRETVGSFVAGTAEDAARAVAAAAKAFPSWRDTPAPKRGEILLEAARIMKERKSDLGRLVTSEMGKVIGEGLGDVQESIDFTGYMAGEGRRLVGRDRALRTPLEVLHDRPPAEGGRGVHHALELPYRDPQLEDRRRAGHR